MDVQVSKNLIRECRLTLSRHLNNIVIHARIQGLLPGGPVQLSENSSDNVFFTSTYFTVLQRVSNGYFKGGGGGPNAISIETHITCDFPGGVLTPYPPSGSAHAILQLIFLISKEPISCGFP